jgi:hypothetical protein
MRIDQRLRKITTASSLVGLALGFLLLGILIVSKSNREAAPITGGALGILLGTAFLVLAFSYWRHQPLKPASLRNP